MCSASRSSNLGLRLLVRPTASCVSSSRYVSSLVVQPRRSVRIVERTQRQSFFSLPDITKLAGLAVGSKDSTGIESDGEEQRFHARKILPYTQEQLYSLVADVPSYSSFIPFCTTSTVLRPIAPGTSSRSRRIPSEWKPDGQPFDIEAELKVGFGGLEERYISRVVGRPFDSVTATASEQTPLFKSLKTTWAFSPASPLSPHASATQSPAFATNTSLSRTPNATAKTSPDEGPTLLTIDLAFSFANPLHRIASQAVLPKVADKMVEAFEKRCLEVWGKGKL